MSSTPSITSPNRISRKRKLSSSAKDHEHDLDTGTTTTNPKLKRRSGPLTKSNPNLLRIEIPTAALESLEDDESDVSGADSLFDDIFDEVSSDEGTVAIATTGVNNTGSSTSLKGIHSDLQTPASSLPPSIFPPTPALRFLPPNPNHSHHHVPIPGFFFDPSILIPPKLASEVVEFCMKTYFSGQNTNVNQVMLFGRAPTPDNDTIPNLTAPNNDDEDDTGCNDVSSTSCSQGYSGLPPMLQTLLSHISTLLLPHLPSTIHSLCFPTSTPSFLPPPTSTSTTTSTSTAPSPASSSTPLPPTPSPNLNRARQAIINLYHPGEGITPHVDLLRRFGDGIVGVSFGSGCVMEFRKVGDGEVIPESYAVPASGTGTSDGAKRKEEDGEAYDLYLPERSVLVMSGDARYKWTHGIPRRKWDYVEDAEGGVDVGVDDSLEIPVVDMEGKTMKDDSDDHVGTGERGTWLERGTRLSITFRFLLPGAEIVGVEE